MIRKAFVGAVVPFFAVLWLAVAAVYTVCSVLAALTGALMDAANFIGGWLIAWERGQ